MNLSYDNITNATTGDNFKQFQFVVYGVCLPTVATIGVLVNFASFIVLTRPSMRSSINVYLAGLSFFDGFLLLFSLLLYPPFSYCELEVQFFDTFWCPYFHMTTLFTFPLTCILQSGSVWTLVAITVDRFIAIKWPLKSRDILTPTRAQIVLSIIAFWSIVYNLPVFFELKHADGGTIQPTALRDNEDYILFYKGYCYLLFMFLIPALTMIVLNGFVTQAVRRAYRVRQQLSGREEKERRCTLTAILVVATFLVLNLMALMNNCVDIFVSHENKPANFSALVNIGNFLVTVNSASNFIIYCALSARFRRTFLKLFCTACCRQDKEYLYINTCYGSFRMHCTGGQRTVTNGGGGTSMVDLNSDNQSLRSFHHDSSRPLLIHSPFLSPQLYRNYQRRCYSQPSQQHHRRDVVNESANSTPRKIGQHRRSSSRNGKRKNTTVQWMQSYNDSPVSCRTCLNDSPKRPKGNT